MPFTQFKLDRSTEQSRGIFNKYVYETSDSLSEVLTPGYFSQSRFKELDGDNTNSMGWAGGFLDLLTDGAYYFCQISDDGNSVSLVSSIELVTDPDTMTSTFEAQPWARYRTDTTSSGYTVTVSTDFQLYGQFRVKDVNASWSGTNILTVDFGGSGYNYQGLAGGAAIFEGDIPNDGQTFILMGGTIGFEQW